MVKCNFQCFSKCPVNLQNGQNHSHLVECSTAQQGSSSISYKISCLNSILKNATTEGLRKHEMLKVSSVQSLDWLGHRMGGHDRWFSRDPLPFCRRPLWVVLAQAGMPTLWCCPSSISTADNSSPTLQSALKNGFGEVVVACNMQTMQLSVSWQLPEVPVNPEGNWSCSVPSRWSRAPSRRCREVSSGICFQKPGSLFSESASMVQQAWSVFHSHRRGWRWLETCTNWCFSDLLKYV